MVSSVKEENPIYDAAREKPEDHETVRVFLEDESHTHATWMGEVWWTQNGEVHPVKWQRMKPRRMSV
jgi:hypothetical protein